METTPTTEPSSSKDCAIIIKHDKTPEGEEVLSIGLVFTRKQDDRSEPSEAEGFGQIAHRAIVQLYEQLQSVPQQPPPNRAQRRAGLVNASGAPMDGGQHMGGNKFGAPDPRIQFKPPTIVPGEERDLHDIKKEREQ